MNLASSFVAVKSENFAHFVPLSTVGKYKLQAGDAFQLGELVITLKPIEAVKDDENSDSPFVTSATMNEDSVEIPPTEKMDDDDEEVVFESDFQAHASENEEEMAAINSKVDATDNSVQSIETSQNHHGELDQDVNDLLRESSATPDLDETQFHDNSNDALPLRGKSVTPTKEIVKQCEEVEDDDMNAATQAIPSPKSTRHYLKRQNDSRPKTAALSAFEDTQDFGEPSNKRLCFNAETQPMEFEPVRNALRKPPVMHLQKSSPPTIANGSQSKSTQSQNPIFQSSDEEGSADENDDNNIITSTPHIPASSFKPNFSQFDSTSQKQQLLDEINQSQDEPETQIEFNHSDASDIDVKATKASQASTDSKKRHLNVPTVDRKRSAIKYESGDEDEVETKDTIASSSSGPAVKKKKRIAAMPSSSEEDDENDSSSVNDSNPLKIMLTVEMDTPKNNELIRKLAGNVVDDISRADVLASCNPLSLSIKVLTAITLGKPIVDENFLKKSMKAKHWLNPDDFILKDDNLEKKKKFVLKDTLKLAAKKKKIFTGHSVYIYSKLYLVTKFKSITPQDIENLIINMGGKVERLTNKVPKHKKIVLLYNPDSNTDLKNKLKLFPNAIKIHDKDLLRIVLTQTVMPSEQ